MSRAVLAPALLVLVFASPASAQGETTMLASGWSMTTRLRGLSDVNAVACSDDQAFARSWRGGVARWDGVRWQELPDVPGYAEGRAYGTQLAASGARALVETSGRVARWDGLAWSSYELGAWPAGSSIGGLALVGGEVLAVGRGRIARLEGSALRSYDAGTWRELSAIAGTSPTDVWTAGQGGTLMHWDGRVWRRAVSGTESWLRGLVVVADRDVWAWSTEGTTLVHYDGRAWTPFAAPPGGPVLGVASRGGRVWVATAGGIFQEGGGAWTSSLGPADFGDDAHAIVGLCATRTHLVVGAGLGSVLVRPI